MSVRPEAVLDTLQPAADFLFAAAPSLAALSVAWEAERRGERWARAWGAWSTGGAGSWADPEDPPPRLPRLALLERLGARLLPSERASRACRHVLLLAPGLALWCEEEGLGGLRLCHFRLWTAAARAGVPLALPCWVAGPLARAAAAGVRSLPGEESAHARLEGARRLPAARARRWLLSRAGGDGVAISRGGPWIVVRAQRSRAVLGIASA